MKIVPKTDTRELENIFTISQLRSELDSKVYLNEANNSDFLIPEDSILSPVSGDEYLYPEVIVDVLPSV